MIRRFFPLAGVCLSLSAAVPAQTPCEVRVSGPSVRIGETVYLGSAARLEATPPACVQSVVDAEAPAIRWEMAEEARGERGKGRFGMPRRAKSKELNAAGLSWPLSNPEGVLRWNPVWSSAPAGTVHEKVEVRSDLPEAFIRVEGVRLKADDSAPASSGSGQVLRLRAEDAGSRVERMVLRTVTTEEGPVLEVQAIDGVGNIGKMEWRLAIN